VIELLLIWGRVEHVEFWIEEMVSVHLWIVEFYVFVDCHGFLFGSAADLRKHDWIVLTAFSLI
jgi:hypothetical protein